MPLFHRQSESRPAQPFARLWVAVAFIVLLDGAYLVGGPVVRALLHQVSIVWSALFLALPLADMWAGRWSPALLGYRRDGWWRYYLWGIAAGAVWRLLDVLVSVGILGTGSRPGGSVIIGWGAWLLNGLVLVPLLEETFFRGYLQAGLAQHMHPWLAILLQSVLFTLHPWHAGQGWVHLPTIFLFGVLTGWLRWRTNSMGGPWGAHGMANVLPEALARFGGFIWR